MRRASAVRGRLWMERRRSAQAWPPPGMSGVRACCAGAVPPRPAARPALVGALLEAALTPAVPAALAHPTIAQATQAACLHTPSVAIAPTNPVAAGDDLVLIVGGQIFNIRPFTSPPRSTDVAMSSPASACGSHRGKRYDRRR